MILCATTFPNLTGTAFPINRPIFVKTTGCSGLAYVLEFVDELAAEDQVFESQGVKVVVDPKSLLYIDGTELDFVKEGLNEGFKFRNPNVASECGCGESFNV